MRGKLIVVEGLDRAGKSLQCARLEQTLNSHGLKTRTMRFPDRTTAIGKMINEYLTNKDHELSDEAIHLLFSANRWEAQAEMERSLNSGESLVLDRYCYSGIAFSAAKGQNFEWCRSCDVGLHIPDLVIFLDVDEETAEKRGGYGAERYETRDMQQKVRQQFLKLREPSWAWISASGTIEEVQKEVEKAAFELYKA